MESVSIMSGDLNEYKDALEDGGEYNPYESCDSLLITFNDSVKIKHYHDELQIASRSMLIHKNWNMVENTKYETCYEYIFTNDDYVEGLNQ